MTIRLDILGVTSIVRALRLRESCYHSLLRNFHSKGICLDTLTKLWAQTVVRIFPKRVEVNGRRILVGDGTKAQKRGKHMPGVKLLHQESDNKAEFIMGHSMQAVNLLVHGEKGVLAVPLAIRIHEGIVFSNRCKKTLPDKMIDLLGKVDSFGNFYFVADAYYASESIATALLKENNHLITRVKSNAVGYTLYEHEGPKKRGRPRVYGDRVLLRSLYKNTKNMQRAISPVYGEKDVTIHYAVRDLLWKPLGRVVRFVVVNHPQRGCCVLMSTDTTLDALEIIRIYGLRFKIEYSFKQAVHQIGTFAYHFWMRQMTPQQRRGGNQYLHRKPREYREAVEEKMHAYHVFLQAGVIAQGLMQYLSVVFPKLVWNLFGSWLRTIRPGVVPSEFVVAEAMRQTLPYFLQSSNPSHAFAKFLIERQDTKRMPTFSKAA